MDHFDGHILYMHSRPASAENGILSMHNNVAPTTGPTTPFAQSLSHAPFYEEINITRILPDILCTLS